MGNGYDELHTLKMMSENIRCCDITGPSITWLMFSTLPFWSGWCRSPKRVGVVTRLGGSASFMPAARAVLQIRSWGTLGTQGNG